MFITPYRFKSRYTIICYHKDNYVEVFRKQVIVFTPCKHSVFSNAPFGHVLRGNKVDRIWKASNLFMLEWSWSYLCFWTSDCSKMSVITFLFFIKSSILFIPYSLYIFIYTITSILFNVFYFFFFLSFLIGLFWYFFIIFIFFVIIFILFATLIRRLKKCL